MSSASDQKKKGPSCPKCGNRLRLRADQVGTQVMCPKCNATFMVGRPGDKRASSDSASDDDAYEPETPLVRATGYDESLMADLSPSANQQTGYDVDWNSADDLEREEPHERPTIDEPDYLEIAERRGLLRKQVAIEPPKWTFFSGVYTFPWRGANLTRWVAASFGLVMTAELFVMAVEYSRSNWLMMPVLSMLSAVTCLLTMSFVSPCFLAAVEDTADGFDEVQETSMPEWDQWFFSFFSLVWVWSLSGVIGYPLTLIEEIGPVAVPVSMFFLFPVLVLSAMECDSFLIPWSPRILGSLTQKLGAWLVFYILGGIVLGGWLAVATWTLSLAPYLIVLVLAPALGAALLIYARLLGRLGWVITGSREATREGPADEKPTSALAPAKKRRRKRNVMPENLDEAARLVRDDRPPAARRDVPRLSPDRSPLA